MYNQSGSGLSYSSYIVALDKSFCDSSFYLSIFYFTWQWSRGFYSFFILVLFAFIVLGCVLDFQWVSHTYMAASAVIRFIVLPIQMTRVCVCVLMVKSAEKISQDRECEDIN